MVLTAYLQREYTVTPQDKATDLLDDLQARTTQYAGQYKAPDEARLPITNRRCRRDGKGICGGTSWLCRRATANCTSRPWAIACCRGDRRRPQRGLVAEEPLERRGAGVRGWTVGRVPRFGLRSS